MKKWQTIWKELLTTVNFDALRCILKGDPSMREITGALKRQNQLDRNKQ